MDSASANTRCEVRIWNEIAGRHDLFLGIDHGDAIATFLSTIVAAPVRLVRVVRLEPVSHAHVISLSLLAEVNDALISSGHATVEAERFRPNIVLTDTEMALPPFIEEHFVDLQWGRDAGTGRLSVLAPCIRCVVPNVDPRTALVSAEPLVTVARLSVQRHPGKPVYVGIYATCDGAAALCAGTTMVATLGF